MTELHRVFVEDDEKPCLSCKDSGVMHYMNNGKSVAECCDQCSKGAKLRAKWAAEEMQRYA